MRFSRIFVFVSLAVSLLLLQGCNYPDDKNSTANEQVETLLRDMSTEEKVGQLMIGFFQGPTLSPELQSRIKSIHLGGVILYSVTGNITGVNQVAGLVDDIQKSAINTGEIPLFISIDQEGGRVARLTDGVTVFPGNMALGAVGSEALSRESAAVTARELRILGITMNFAPVVDVNSNPKNPIIGVRSFGSSPAEVARLGRAMIAPYEREGVICTAKHFPGHGDTDVDSHLGLPVINSDLAHLRDVETPPFISMIEGGVPAIMTAHVLVPAIDKELPATLSPTILGLLRKSGFNGLIITDSLTMGAVVKEWGVKEAAIRALIAGADILLFGADTGHKPDEQEQVFNALVEAVRSGRISQERLNDAVRRVLAAKIKYRIIDNPFPKKSLMNTLASPESIALAKRIAQESITLVRNEKGILPLSGDTAIPIIWPLEYKEAIKPLLQECPFLQQHFISLDSKPSDIDDVIESLKENKTVIVATYDLRKYPAWKNLLQQLNHKRIAVIAMRDPYDLLLVPSIGTYIATYGDTRASVEALGKLLKGDIPPKGLLPVDLPGLYSRGWGLTGFIHKQ